jgi:putative peptide zinc metalloprotease protein
VASRFFFVGLILAAWAILNMLILPLLKSLRYLHSSPVLVGRRFRAIMLTGSLVSGLGLVIFMVPAPSTTVTEGVIWAPENTAVRPETGGFVEKVFAQNGAQVASGEPLVQLADPELDARIEGLRAQIEELESRFQTTVLKDRVEADQLLEQRAQIIEMLDVALSQWHSLLVTSPVSGRFVTEDLRDLEGQYWSRGMTIGHVLDAHAQLVRVIVTQSEVDLVRNNTRMVEVRPSAYCARFPRRLTSCPA